MQTVFSALHCLQKFILLIGCLSFQNILAQKNARYFSSTTAVQYGYAVKITADISSVESFSFRIGLSGGIGAFLGNNWLYPSLNGDIMLYHGGLGSNHPGKKKGNGLSVESVLSYTATIGWNNRMSYTDKARPGERNYPLYYFSNWNIPSLQNPYRYSASIGGNAIIFYRRGKNKSQLVGFLNAHVDRFQVSYTNDGPPFKPPLGDKFDRYHTGGGFISFHGNDDWAINLIEVGYNKFTGYSPSSYELSNKIGSSYVFYKDPNENYYNKSNLYLNIGNSSKHWGVSVIAYNDPKLDIQHRIHNNMYFPLHLVPYAGSIAIGGNYYYQQSKIGLQ